MRAGVLTVLLLLPAALVAQNADLHVMPIRGNVFMLIGAGSNVTVSAGVDGVLVVDAGSAAMADKTLAVISEIDRATSEPGRLTTCVGPACYQPGSLGPFTPFGWAGPSYNAVIASPKPPKPIRWILQTTADPEHTGGTAKLAVAGKTYNGGEAGRLIGDVTPATVIGHENILKRMTQTKFPEAAWPTETYYIPTYKMSQYINGEGIQMYYAPAAIDDTDSIVYFRYSDVISAGDIYTPGRYPMIDSAKGGTVQGEIDALNKIIDIAFPEYRHQGGTMIVPGHGRLGDTAEGREGDLGLRRHLRNAGQVHRGGVPDSGNEIATVGGVPRSARTVGRVPRRGRCHRERARQRRRNGQGNRCGGAARCGARVCAPLPGGAVRHEQAGQDRRDARPVSVPQSPHVHPNRSAG
jgi:cyclase